MDNRAFTIDSLTALYKIVSGALRPRMLRKLPVKLRVRVRETTDWKQHAGNLESEMLNRGMFEIINWSEDQGRLP